MRIEDWIPYTYVDHSWQFARQLSREFKIFYDAVATCTVQPYWEREAEVFGHAVPACKITVSRRKLTSVLQWIGIFALSNSVTKTIMWFIIGLPTHSVGAREGARLVMIASLVSVCRRLSASLSSVTRRICNVTHHEWMNEWKCEDFKCVWKPTESRLCLTHYVNKSSRWATCTVQEAAVAARGGPVGLHPVRATTCFELQKKMLLYFKGA